MNRRRFLELMGIGIGSSAIVYSFPSIIVPKNIIENSEDIGCCLRLNTPVEVSIAGVKYLLNPCNIFIPYPHTVEDVTGEVASVRA